MFWITYWGIYCDSENENLQIFETPRYVDQKLVMGMIRLLIPQQSDNEKAADIIRVDIGQNNKFIQWVAVRPDTLIIEDIVSKYEIFASPTRSALFNPGKQAG